VNSNEPPQRIILPLFNEQDFAKAKVAIVGFDPHKAYDDYRFEQDGWLVALTSCGEDAIQVPLTLESFLSWCQISSSPCDLIGLDEFAMLVRELRDDPEYSLAAGMAGDVLDLTDRRYREWLMSLGRHSNNAGVRAYLRFLVEAWIAEPSGLD
jgi:hypothetical protein